MGRAGAEACESLCGESARWRDVQRTEMRDKEEPAVPVLPGEETLGQGPKRSKGTTYFKLDLAALITFFIGFFRSHFE